MIGSMVEGSEVFRTEFRKSWEIRTKLGLYVSTCGQHTT